MQYNNAQLIRTRKLDQSRKRVQKENFQQKNSNYTRVVQARDTEQY